MRKRNLPKTKSSKVRRQRDPIPWKYCLLTVACGLLLVAGFFYAARSHFSSMDYAMKNAELRREIEDLKSETRRLKLSKEIALSPAEIKKAAQKLGLTTMTVKNIEVVKTKAVKAAGENTGKKRTASAETRKDAEAGKTSEKNGAAPENDSKRETPPAEKKRDKREAAENQKKDGNFRNQVARR